MTSLLVAAALAAGPAEAAKAKKAPKDSDTAVQEITIRGKGPGGPPVTLPPAGPGAPAADEVIGSLDVLRVEHRAPAPELRVPGGPSRRLAKPFPEPPYLRFDPSAFRQPYERWAFEVLAGGDVVWRVAGSGAALGKLEWDGTDSSGRFAARVGLPYHFRFTGTQGADEATVTSDPVELGSLLYRENLGDRHMEIASPLLFSTGKGALLDSALPYLNEVANRLRRVRPSSEPFRFTLYQKAPESKAAKGRERSLRAFFSKALLVHPNRVSVEVKAEADRGEAFACVLPPDTGQAIRAD